MQRLPYLEHITRRQDSLEKARMQGKVDGSRKTQYRSQAVKSKAFGSGIKFKLESEGEWEPLAIGLQNFSRCFC